jgi:hypothetical protein
VRVVGVAHDRREHTVDVEQDRAVRRVGAQRLDVLGECRGSGHRSSVASLSRFIAFRRE